MRKINGILTEQAGFKSWDGPQLFFNRELLPIYSCRVGLFLITKICYRTVQTLPSSFLFLFIIFHGKISSIRLFVYIFQNVFIYKTTKLFEVYALHLVGEIDT